MTTAQLAMAVAFALPCFMMAWRLLRVWREPMAVEGGRWVGLGTGVFVLEFILLHAGVLLGGLAAQADGTWTRVGATAGLAAFYGLFAVVIAAAFRSRMLLGSFLWLIGGRFVALAIGVAELDTLLLVARSGIGMALYVLLAIASVIVPVPRFGITAEVAAATRIPNAGGAWVEEPHRAIGAATVYFLLLGVAELALLSWVDPRSVVAR